MRCRKLSPDAVLRADALAVRTAAENRRHGAPALASEVRGASLIAEVFKGRARAAVPAIINGEPGAVWAVGAQIRAAFLFIIERGKITALDLVMNPGDLAQLAVKFE
jgi:RNA polymerase sigma-70 factor (ECF subfamily)